MAMMGVFFVLFSLPAFYWAIYNFNEYRRTNDFIEQLSENFNKNQAPEAGQEYSERVSAMSSRSERYKLEMLGSGAGGFILLGISALLFIKSFKSRKQKTLYEPLNPQKIPPPLTPLEIKYKKTSAILLLLLTVFFGAMLLLIVYQNFTSRFITAENAFIRSLIFAVPLLILLSFLTFLTIRAKRQAVKSIAANGITRGDGRHFAWTEFCGVITQTARSRFGKNHVWRSELAFANGETAWLIPHRIKNADEVFDYISKLPQAAPKMQ